MPDKKDSRSLPTILFSIAEQLENQKDSDLDSLLSQSLQGAKEKLPTNTPTAEPKHSDEEQADAPTKSQENIGAVFIAELMKSLTGVQQRYKIPAQSAQPPSSSVVDPASKQSIGSAGSSSSSVSPQQTATGLLGLLNWVVGQVKNKWQLPPTGGATPPAPVGPATASERAATNKTQSQLPGQAFSGSTPLPVPLEQEKDKESFDPTGILSPLLWAIKDQLNYPAILPDNQSTAKKTTVTDTTSSLSVPVNPVLPGPVFVRGDSVTNNERIESRIETSQQTNEKTNELKTGTPGNVPDLLGFFADVQNNTLREIVTNATTHDQHIEKLLSEGEQNQPGGNLIAVTLKSIHDKLSPTTTLASLQSTESPVDIKETPSEEQVTAPIVPVVSPASGVSPAPQQQEITVHVSQDERGTVSAASSREESLTLPQVSDENRDQSNIIKTLERDSFDKADSSLTTTEKTDTHSERQIDRTETNRIQSVLPDLIGLFQTVLTVHQTLQKEGAVENYPVAGGQVETKEKQTNSLLSVTGNFFKEMLSQELLPQDILPSQQVSVSEKETEQNTTREDSTNTVREKSRQESAISKLLEKQTAVEKTISSNLIAATSNILKETTGKELLTREINRDSAQSDTRETNNSNKETSVVSTTDKTTSDRNNTTNNNLLATTSNILRETLGKTLLNFSTEKMSSTNSSQTTEEKETTISLLSQLKEAVAEKITAKEVSSRTEESQKETQITTTNNLGGGLSFDPVEIIASIADAISASLKQSLGVSSLGTGGAAAGGLPVIVQNMPNSSGLNSSISTMNVTNANNTNNSSTVLGGATPAVPGGMNMAALAASSAMPNSAITPNPLTSSPIPVTIVGQPQQPTPLPVPNAPQNPLLPSGQQPPKAWSKDWWDEPIEGDWFDNLGKTLPIPERAKQTYEGTSQGAMDFLGSGTNRGSKGEMGMASGMLDMGASLAKMVPGVGNAIAGVMKLGSTAFGAVDKLQQWNRSIHESNIQFGQFSGAMAVVAAQQEARDIQLSREKGDARADSAMYQAEQMSRLERTLAPLGNALSNLKNKVVGGVTESVSDFLEGKEGTKGGGLREATEGMIGLGGLGKKIRDAEKDALKDSDLADKWMFDLGNDWAKKFGRPDNF